MATRRFRNRRAAADLGAASVEYAILASLIAGVVIGTVIILGNSTHLLFDTVVQVWP